MDRDEFMELVYETFADEPDNVLANRIIEAADAYAEYEKAQLSCEGTTSDLISRQAAIDAINHICPVDTEYDCTLLDRVDVRCVLSDLPSVQPNLQPTCNQFATDTISRQAAIDALDFEIVHMTAYCDGKNEGNPLAQYNKGLEDGKKAIEALPPAQPVATDTNVGDKISKFIDGLEEIFADLRERHVDDSVCGLCEYDGAYMGQSGNWCNECPGFDRDDCFKLSDKTRKEWTEEIVKALPTIQPEVLACGNGELVATPEPTDIDAREAVYNLAEKIGIHQLFALTVELRGEPIQPEPQWIPVSERMPKDYVDVLVWFEYFRYGDYNCLYQAHGIGTYVAEYNSWMINHESGWKDLRVIAWMPLPEPYKPNNE